MNVSKFKTRNGVVYVSGKEHILFLRPTGNHDYIHGNPPHLL